MANDPRRPARAAPNDVQDVGVRGVREEAGGAVQGESGDWRLSVAALRFHKRHLQSGITPRGHCRVCQSGLAGALEARGARLLSGTRNRYPSSQTDRDL